MKPVLFELGPIVIRSWGVMVALGIIAGLYYVRKVAVRNGIDDDKILNLTFYIVLAGLIGARLIFVLTNLDFYGARPFEILMVQRGGLSAHGAILGGIIATFLFVRYHKLSFLKIADIIAPALLLGQAIGRVGCFLAGHCQGTVTDFFLKVKFPLLVGYRHPVQLYEGGLDLLAFGLLVVFGKNFKKDGNLLAVALIVYSLIRFITDFVRDYDTKFLGLSYSQIASLAIIIGFSLTLLIINAKPLTSPSEE